MGLSASEAKVVRISGGDAAVNTIALMPPRGVAH
jgi:hypothetical protein